MARSNSPKDLWESADAYEHFMGRWSRELARVFVLWLGIPSDRHWLEVGCGTGALTSQILEVGRPASLLATDSSEQFIKHARATFKDHRIQFLSATADNLPTSLEGYDVVISSLVLNFLPNPIEALRRMRSRIAENGIVAACVWDYSRGMQFLRRFWDAAVELDPTARQYDEGKRFPICTPSALEAAFHEAGFSYVRIEALEITTHFQNFEDYWLPFVGGPGPAPGYLSSLPAQRQQDLKRRLETMLPRNEDGSITLTATAWATRAEKKPPN